MDWTWVPAGWSSFIAERHYNRSGSVGICGRLPGLAPMVQLRLIFRVLSGINIRIHAGLYGEPIGLSGIPKGMELVDRSGPKRTDYMEWKLATHLYLIPKPNQYVVYSSGCRLFHVENGIWKHLLGSWIQMEIPRNLDGGVGGTYPAWGLPIDAAFTRRYSGIE